MNNNSDNWTGLHDPSTEGGRVSEDTDTLNITIKAIGIPLGITILLGNALFMVIILKAKRPKCIHTNLIIHVTVSDLLAGFTLLLQFALERLYSKKTHGDWAEMEEQYHHQGYHVICRAWASIQMLPIYQPFLFLCGLNLDRLVAISYPATYANTWKATAAKCLPVLVWPYSVLICLLALSAKYDMREHNINKDGCGILTLPPLYLTLTLLIHILPATLVAVVAFLQIKRELRIHQRKIQVTNTMTYENLIKDMAIARRDFCVTITTFIIWAPFLTSLILWHSSHNIHPILYVIRGTLLMGYLSSLRFIAFILGSAHFKESFWSLWRCRPHSQHIPGQRRSRPSSHGT